MTFAGQRVLGAVDKDPDAILPYTIDWAQWLPSGATISTAAWTTPAGITKGDGSNGAPAPTKTNTTATVWLIGGTAGADYLVTCRIATNTGLTDDRTVRIKCIQR